MTKPTLSIIKSPPPTPDVDVHPVTGPSFLVFRRQGKKISREKREGARAPRFRHPTFEAACEEAGRLARLYPESTFVVIGEMAIVKALTADNAQ